MGSWKLEVNREQTTDNREQRKDEEMREVGSGKLEVGSQQTTENRQQITDRTTKR